MITTKKPVTSLSEKWTPRKYQESAIRLGLELSHFGYLLDPGLGKTSIILAIIKILKARGLFEGALIIAPLRVCYSVWPAEIQRWAEFNHLTVSILHGPDKEKNIAKSADIYLINPEGLAWLYGPTKPFKKLKVDMLVVDELSKFKDSSTKRFKLLKPQLARYSRRYGLTGTPASNGLIDLFGQIYVLDQGLALGRYVTHYRMRYFIPGGFQMREYTPAPGADVAIQNAIAPITLRLKAEDYIDLPPQLDVSLFVDLPPAARKAYVEMEAVAFTELESKAILTAPTAASVMTKCRQLAAGATYIEGEEKWEHIHDEKLDALGELIDELQGKPLLVAYGFRHDLERILKRFGKGVPWIGGGTSPKRADKLARDWNAGKLPLLLGHPASIGHGLNLQGSGACHLCWFTPPWDLELYEQMNRRIRRQGSTAEQVFVHHIIARKTVDVAVLAALARKGEVQNRLLDALSAYRRGEL